MNSIIKLNLRELLGNVNSISLFDWLVSNKLKKMYACLKLDDQWLLKFFLFRIFFFLYGDPIGLFSECFMLAHFHVRGKVLYFSLCDLSVT